MDQPGKVANPARGQLNRENEYCISLSAFAPENLVSRDGFGSPVPRQPVHLHTQAYEYKIDAPLATETAVQVYLVSY